MTYASMTTSKLPKKPDGLIIGGIGYEVYWYDASAFDVDSDAGWGEEPDLDVDQKTITVQVTGHVDCDQAKIKVADKQDEQVKRVVLLHEVVHAILIQTGHPEVSEDAVRALGYGLYDFLATNRVEVDWLTQRE